MTTEGKTIGQLKLRKAELLVILDQLADAKLKLNSAMDSLTAEVAELNRAIGSVDEVPVVSEKEQAQMRYDALHMELEEVD